MSEFVLISKEPSNLEEENRIEVLRHKVIDSNDPDDKQEFYKACAKWFQQRHLRAVNELDYAKQQPSHAETEDDLTIAYMHGYHKGKESLDREAIRNEVLESAAEVIEREGEGWGEDSKYRPHYSDMAAIVRAMKYQPAQPSDSRTEFSDTEILDWMISNDVNVNDSFKQGCWNVYGVVRYMITEDHKTPRDAIKAAMQADREDK